MQYDANFSLHDKYILCFSFFFITEYKKTKNQVIVAAEAFDLDKAVENYYEDEVREAFSHGHLDFGVNQNSLSLIHLYANSIWLFKNVLAGY